MSGSPTPRGEPDPLEITRLLAVAREGDPSVQGRLMALVYDRLHHMAARMFASQPAGVTLQPTALVHEAWLKLDAGGGHYSDQRHFYIVAARAMRQVLADAARKRNAQRRGDGAQREPHVDALAVSVEGRGELDALALEESLADLERLDPVHARLVELRVFAGMTAAEAAQELGLTPAQADSAWVMAKAWLRRRWGSG